MSREESAHGIRFGSSEDPLRRGGIQRRVVLTSVGAVVFSFAAIGVFGGEASAQKGGGSSCANGDDSCEGPDGDCDISAEPLDDDDRDKSCGKGEADEACNLIPGASEEKAGHDEDQNCSEDVGGGDGDKDNACGDCNDNHDVDDNCGGTTDGGQPDSDENCGHPHYVGGDEDNACSQSTPDAGCGTHAPTYSPPWVDSDQHCDSSLTPGTTPESDQNCSTEEADATCGNYNLPYSTSPDENCDTDDLDEACGGPGTANGDPSYDLDQSCSPSSADESCGGGAPLGLPGASPDEANP